MNLKKLGRRLAEKIAGGMHHSYEHDSPSVLTKVNGSS